MGRPGGGGGHSSGGHSGGGHSSGGHSMGGGGSFGGSRPGGGGSFGGGSRPGGAGSGGPMGGPGGPMGGPGGRPPRRGWFGRFFYGPGFGYGYGGRGGCGCLMVIIIALVMAVISVFGGIVSFSSRNSSTSSGRSFWFSSDDGYSSDYSDVSGRYSSDTTREKVDTGVAFTSDCVIDELGWIDDVESTGEVLETFYDATGVQPYVYLKAYDESLTTDSEKVAYAEDWYDENIDNEGTFLYVYFAEEDAENDMGYFAYVCGEDAATVMDDEAIEIFWDYHDDYWYSDLSMGDMLAETFDATAEAIMN